MGNKKTVAYKGKNYKVFNLNTAYGSAEVICVPEQYRNNKTLAVLVYCVEDNTVSELFSVLTVNLDNAELQSDTTAYLDTNNNPWAEKFVKENGIADPTFLMEKSGFWNYPLYCFDLKTLTA